MSVPPLVESAALRMSVPLWGKGTAGAAGGRGELRHCGTWLWHAADFKTGEVGGAVKEDPASFAHYTVESARKVFEVGVDVAPFGRERDRQYMWVNSGPITLEIDLVSHRSSPD